MERIVTIDITDRIRPYTTENGIYISNADIPKGNHRIQIQIADNKGNSTLREMAFLVQ